MGHKIYLLLMIILPTFVGSGATLDLISYLSGNYTGSMGPIYLVLLALVGMGVGISYAWSVIKAADGADNKREEVIIAYIQKQREEVKLSVLFLLVLLPMRCSETLKGMRRGISHFDMFPSEKYIGRCGATSI